MGEGSGGKSGSVDERRNRHLIQKGVDVEQILFQLVVTMKNSTKIDLGNNEEISKGIFPNSDGTFTAMTFTQSKDFKTYKGAVRWMAKRSN